jgi:A/G-specific adenine glycosylase
VARDKGNNKNLTARLLGWFDRERRSLPWRAKAKRDPYKVWLAEIMLQQTTVAAVIPYFEKFQGLYPDVKTLARAPLEEVLKNWAGLGYYARARNLHKCANIVAGKLNGYFPTTVKDLKELPGIGPYTAAAIAAFAFGVPATVVDGNVERVMARLFAVPVPLPGAKAKLYSLAAALTPHDRPGDYAEAVMDLGATVCTPNAPDCPHCPLRGFCLAFKHGLQDALPKRGIRKAKPTRHGVVFWLEDKGRVLVRRRPETGLLGGMLEFPSTPWQEGDIPSVHSHAPLDTQWTPVLKEVRHTFTHFHLRLTILTGQGHVKGGSWLEKDQLLAAGFPTVMNKVIARVLGTRS